MLAAAPGLAATPALAATPGLAATPALAATPMSPTVANAGALTPQDEFRLGQDLFEGKIDLQGRIRTHVADLPPEVVRCGNCHAVANEPDVPRSLAPRLTHDLLIARRSRRGGPASNYDRNSFCTLLREGFDPAHVLISVEMPRYTLDDTNCAALWRFVIGTEHAADTHTHQ
jgi:hypothetical protein